ncbi:MAG: TraR/DksA C4-type zinc finger protein [Verrucomicrobia bacterium]|nr:TraR/DksA C4-type zinc finger protein [Verrucomicrobiota bacterium]
MKKDKESKAKSAAPAPSGDANPAPERSAFVQAQHQRLLELQDHLLDAMAGVAQDNLRSRAEGSEASAFGMHQADAGSDAYDRDFALNLLSQEQDALYEIQEAIKRVEDGTYGICEMSGQAIPEARLEAIPFARLTVECQEKLEQQNGYSSRSYGRPTRSLFGLMDGNEEGEPVDND